MFIMTCFRLSYLVLSKSFLNSELVLVVKVQFLYVIHQVDYYIGQKDKYKPIQIVPGHNRTDINHPVGPACMRTSRHISYLLKVTKMV